MANRFVRYIVVLLVSLCCTAGVHAQTDSVANYNDSIAVDTTASGDGDNYDNHESTAGLTKFNQKQTLQQVEERKLNGRETETLKKENGWWYNKKEEKDEKKAGSGSNGRSNSTVWNFLGAGFLRIVFWVIVVGAFVLILVLYLRTFTGSSRKIRDIGVSVEAVPEDIFTLNFDEQISRALAEHNYRLATRLLFLRVLRTMAEKGVINYGHDKTNMDYLFELGNTRYARDFMQASRNYEYVWYGNFIPAQSQFVQIRQQLDDLNQKITN